HHPQWEENLLETHLLDPRGALAHEDHFGPHRTVGDLYQAFFPDDPTLCEHHGRTRGNDEHHRPHVHFQGLDRKSAILCTGLCPGIAGAVGGRIAGLYFHHVVRPVFRDGRGGGTPLS